MIVNEDYFDNIEIDDENIHIEPELKSERKWRLYLILYVATDGFGNMYYKKLQKELVKTKYILDKVYQIDNAFLSYYDNLWKKDYAEMSDVNYSSIGFKFGIDIDIDAGYMQIVSLIKYLIMNGRGMNKFIQFVDTERHIEQCVYKSDICNLYVGEFESLPKALYVCGLDYDYERLLYKLCGKNTGDVFVETQQLLSAGVRSKYICMGEVSPEVFADKSMVNMFNFIKIQNTNKSSWDFSNSDDKTMIDVLQSRRYGDVVLRHLSDCSRGSMAKCYIRLLISNSYTSVYFYVVFTRTCAIDIQKLPENRILVMEQNKYGAQADCIYGIAQGLYVFNKFGFDIDDMISKIYNSKRVKDSLDLPFNETKKKIKEMVNRISEVSEK